MRQAFARGLWRGGAMAGADDGDAGAASRGGDRRVERDADAAGRRRRAAPRAIRSPDGRLTFDKLSSVFLSGNRTRDDQPSHIARADAGPARARRAVGAHVPGAGLRGRRRAEDGTVEVQLSPSNCVQCGAITAKGGRLTPPEGGSGPEYTLT